MTEEEQREIELSMTLYRLGEAIFKARPQNSFINDLAIESGWIGQPDYKYNRFTTD